MEPLRSPETRLMPSESSLLLDVADAAILAGLEGGSAPSIAIDVLPDRLHQTLGSFVTLTVADQLNGCIGHVEGVEPLARDVAHLAWSAAFDDPRLPSLEWSDRSALTIEISLLSPLRPIGAESYEHLIDQLEPGRHGLVVRVGRAQGLFLPSVWEQLPDPHEFLHHLLRKAGLAPGPWPERLEAHRFVTMKYRRRLGPEAVDDDVGVRASR